MLDGIFNSISEKIKNFVSSIGQWWLHDNLPSWMIQKSSFGGAGGGDLDCWHRIDERQLCERVGC
jgi:hypothetical protein